jgi:hypothetical protein
VERNFKTTLGDCHRAEAVPTQLFFWLAAKWAALVHTAARFAVVALHSTLSTS